MVQRKVVLIKYKFRVKKLMPVKNVSVASKRVKQMMYSLEICKIIYEYNSTHLENQIWRNGMTLATSNKSHFNTLFTISQFGPHKKLSRICV